MNWSFRILSSGIDAAALDREVKSIAAVCVQAGRHPSSVQEEALEWAKRKTQQIFPSPGKLPPLPRKPFLSPWMMALFVLPFLGLTVLVGASSSKHGVSILAAGVVFWVTYIFVWILTGVWSKMHEQAVSRYWARYDPHRFDRSPLQEDLRRLVETAIIEAWNEYHRPIATVAPQEVAAAPRAPLPWTPSGERPRPRVSCTAREAEFLARDWMLYLGAAGAKVSSATRDGGMDVVAKYFVAEVKHHASPVPPNLVRQIFGVAAAERKQALFFSLSGYSAAAVEFARQAEIALFVYDFAAGTLSAKSPAATKALSNGLGSLISR